MRARELATFEPSLSVGKPRGLLYGTRLYARHLTKTEYVKSDWARPGGPIPSRREADGWKSAMRLLSRRASRASWCRALHCITSNVEALLPVTATRVGTRDRRHDTRRATEFLTTQDTIFVNNWLFDTFSLNFQVNIIMHLFTATGCERFFTRTKLQDPT